MELNKKEFTKFFNEHFDGNYNKCGRVLGISPAQIHRVINNGSKAGLVFLSRLINYCSKNNLEYNHFIFIPEMLTLSNEK